MGRGDDDGESSNTCVLICVSRLGTGKREGVLVEEGFGGREMRALVAVQLGRI